MRMGGRIEDGEARDGDDGRRAARKNAPLA